MTRTILLAFICFIAITSCKKDDFDAAKQAETDQKLINDYAVANNLTTVQHASGLRYVILSPGTGTLKYTTSTAITAKYVGRLLNGQVFDSSSSGANFTLGGVIVGWQVGIPLIQKGGKIRLLIPSALAYGNVPNGPIPANSVLDFEIELINAQ